MLDRLCGTVLVVWLVFGTVARGERPASGVDEATILATLTKERPRLILTGARLNRLRELSSTDQLLATTVTKMLAKADECLKAGPLSGTDTGALVQEGKRRVYPLAFAYRWAGQENYARKVEEDLHFLCSLPDWTPAKSFLGTAEMAHVVGIGYDWCNGAWSDTSRRAIRAGLVRNGLQPFLQAQDNKVWWTRTPYNWSQVCHGGTLVGALAIANDEPVLAARVVAAAVRSLPRALGTYDPDGLWPEGFDYWQYATDYAVLALASLETALGTDFGLGEREGLRQAGMAVIWGAGPFQQYVNFADTLENKKRWALPYLFYLARRYDLPLVAQIERQAMSQWPEVLDIVWYVPPGSSPPTAPVLDHAWRGPVELATFRSGWDDPQALFASLKAGNNAVNHGHLDLGVFELDALGVRWARDLGKDSYGLPGYFSDRASGGQAWQIYRLRSASHSVPLLDRRDQPVTASAKMTAFHSEGDRAFAVVDFTAAYAPAAKSARRGLALIGGRRSILVQDEFDLVEPAELTWAMTTEAAIETDAEKAVMTLKGQKLQAVILSPEGATFAIESAEQAAPQSRNAGVRRLMIRQKCESGRVRVTVWLVPAWPDTTEAAPPPMRELSGW